ncbi:hypothetical protein FRC12_022011 [Ceratobasidium sp. 428]|nr:hypothetical protein FRC12_022011 [Ceratobasidium sp. 428]
MYVHIDMGPVNWVSAAIWTTNQEVVLGSVLGAIYALTVRAGTSFEQHEVRIIKLIHEMNSTVLALAYDTRRNRLAVGYTNALVIWERIDSKTWRRLDTLRIGSGRATIRITTLNFFGSYGELFVGSCSGPMVWRHEGQLVPLATEPETPQILATAFSHDQSVMAVSTLDDSVIVWPVADRPLTILTQSSHTHHLESGHESRLYDPCTPIAITRKGYIVYGTSDGVVGVISHQGERYQTLTREAHSVRIITSSSNMLYVSFKDIVGAVTVVGYTDDDSTYRRFRARPETQPRSAFYHFADVYQPLNQIVIRPNPKRECVNMFAFACLAVVLAMWALALAGPKYSEFAFNIPM